MQPVDLQGLQKIADQLDSIGVEYAFTGGMVVGFLLDHPNLIDLRPTKDVDAIVAVTRYGQHMELEEKLRSSGFTHDLTEGAPTCRFQYAGILVDVMPVLDETGRFENPWFPIALQHAREHSLEGYRFRTVNAPGFLATKLAAFHDRGKGDWYSHDLEDLLTVIDGRAEIVEDVKGTAPELKEYISHEVRSYLKRDAFLDCLPGHLLPDTASQQRLPILLEKLRKIAALTI